MTIQYQEVVAMRATRTCLEEGCGNQDTIDFQNVEADAIAEAEAWEFSGWNGWSQGYCPMHHPNGSPE